MEADFERNFLEPGMRFQKVTNGKNKRSQFRLLKAVLALKIGGREPLSFQVLK